MKNKLIIFTAIIGISFFSCLQIKDVTHKLSNFSNIQFKIENISKFQLLDIPISTKQSLTDFSPAEVLKISSIFSQKKLPVSFVLNIAVKNPNNGFDGKNLIPVTLKQLRWKLFIDGVETISGTLNKEYSLPTDNTLGLIPLEISIDLLQFFENRGYNSLMNLILTLGGTKSDPSIILLEAEPLLSTPFGTIRAPIVRITNSTFN
ncbi:MAG: hypothetical protein ACUVQ1_04550 [Candidatus Kapaibacteriales bacterium]